MSRPSAAGSGLSDLSGVGLSLAFVVIWASGFVVARYAAPHADPFTFLSVRFAITAVIFVALVPLAGAPWPRRKETWAAALISGVLIHGLYLGGMFWAMWHDLPAGIAALIGGLQPIVTATLVGPFLGERIRPAHWLGLSIGLASVGLVVAPTLGQIDGIPLPSVIVALGAMLALTLGTIWQKRAVGPLDLRVSGAIQFMGALLVTAPMALLTESLRLDNTPALWGTLLWSVVVISLGGISVLMVLIRRGAVSVVSVLLYLVPATSAVMAFVVLGETMTPIQIAGMALSVLGVFIALRASR